MEEALKWLCADVVARGEEPLWKLSEIYSKGIGVEKDPALAEYWRNRAKYW